MRNPEALPRELELDKDRQLQCTTCHDPHDNKYGNFLVMDNTESRMCQSCHTLDQSDPVRPRNVLRLAGRQP